MSHSQRARSRAFLRAQRRRRIARRRATVRARFLPDISRPRTERETAEFRRYILRTADQHWLCCHRCSHVDRQRCRYQTLQEDLADLRTWEQLDELGYRRFFHGRRRLIDVGAQRRSRRLHHYREPSS